MPCTRPDERHGTDHCEANAALHEVRESVSEMAFEPQKGGVAFEDRVLPSRGIAAYLSRLRACRFRGGDGVR